MRLAHKESSFWTIAHARLRQMKESIVCGPFEEQVVNQGTQLPLLRTYDNIKDNR